MEATPEIREDKVGQFKGEIESGTYSVEGDKVAPKMLRESLIDAFI
jgi:anti-sigma28 factor (negative regulator of flagellin synthesis)